MPNKFGILKLNTTCPRCKREIHPHSLTMYGTCVLCALDQTKLRAYELERERIMKQRDDIRSMLSIHYHPDMDDNVKEIINNENIKVVNGRPKALNLEKRPIKL